MYSSNAPYDFDSQQRQVVLEGRRILERTGESLARSNQVAIETEAIGVEVISELGDQRETLLRAKDRLSQTDAHLDQAKNVLKKMGRNVLYNKLILIIIILLEIAILVGISYIRFFKK